MSPRHSRLIDRARNWFGYGNILRMRTIPLGRGRLGFIGPRRFWIYQEHEHGPPTSVVIQLTEKMRGQLLDALEAGDDV